MSGSKDMASSAFRSLLVADSALNPPRASCLEVQTRESWRIEMGPFGSRLAPAFFQLEVSNLPPPQFPYISLVDPL